MTDKQREAVRKAMAKACEVWSDLVCSDYRYSNVEKFRICVEELLKVLEEPEPEKKTSLLACNVCGVPLLEEGRACWREVCPGTAEKYVRLYGVTSIVDGVGPGSDFLGFLSFSTKDYLIGRIRDEL